MNDNVVLDSSLYDIHNLNVISSTKINQKVTQILRVFGVLLPVSSAQSKKTEDDDDAAKTAHDEAGTRKERTIVIIRAKANVASKLISIVEILKRDLARRAIESREANEKTTEDDETEQQGAARSKKAPIPRLYQYTSVTTIPAEVKIKPPQPKPTQPPSTAALVPEDPQQQGTKRKRPVDSSQDSTIAALTTKPAKKKQKQDDSVEDEPETATPEEDEAEEFEVMAKSPAVGSAGKDAGVQAAIAVAPAEKQMRDVPVLTVYLCSAPVEALDRAFGEQVG